MRPFSLKRQQQEKQLEKVVAQIRRERGNVCEDCGYIGRVDPSHNYSRKDFASLIADPENLTLLCRKHHQAFENNRFWELKSDSVLRKMKEQYENEPDIFRSERMQSHLIGKLYAGKDNAEAWEVKNPEFVDILLKEVVFK